MADEASNSPSGESPSVVPIEGQSSEPTIDVVTAEASAPVTAPDPSPSSKAPHPSPVNEEVEPVRETSSFVPELETHPQKARYSLRKPPEDLVAAFGGKGDRKKSRAGLKDSDASLVRVELLPGGDLGQRIEVSGYGAAPRVAEVFPAEDLDSVIEAVEVEQIELNIEAEAQQQILNFDLSTEYQKPSVERALQYRKLHMPTKNDGSQFPIWGTKTGRFVFKCCSLIDCCFEGRKSEFIPFGPGVTAYFKFIKALTVLFVILCLMSVPFLAVNLNGGTHFSKHPFPFAQTTLGNLYAEFNSTAFLLSNSSTLDALNETIATGQFVTYTLRMPAFCSGNRDGCVFERTNLLQAYAIWDCAVSCVIIIALNMMIYFTKHETYVYKQKVPKIEDYSLQCTVPANADAKSIQAHFESILAKVDSKRNREVEIAGHEKFDDIYDVQIVESTGNAISLCIKRGFLLKRLARLDAKIKWLRARQVHESRINPFENKYNKTRERIMKLDEKAMRRAERGRALMGFVTFETQEAKLRMLHEYDVFWACGQQPKRLKFQGETVMRVKPAPPPSTLLWENQEISLCNRFIRLCLAMLIFAATLGVTAGLSFVTDSNRVFNEVLDIASGEGFKRCDGRYDSFPTLAAAAQAAKTAGDTSCFCDYELLADKPVGAEDNGFLFIPGGMCSDHVFSKVTSIGKEIGLSFVIMVINILIYRLVIVTAEFMRFRNVVAREFAILRSIFIITLINAAFICLLVNTDWAKLTRAKIDDIKFGDGTTFIRIGQFVDFEPQWYSRVGVELFLIGLLNIIGPHVLPMLRYMYHVLERKYMAPYAVSQQVLNEMYIGEEFLLSVRLAQTCMMVWYILLYSSGLPIMYFVGLVSLVVAYWIDKLNFVRLVRTPPQFDTALQIWTLKAMEYGVIAHLLMGMWMYSSPRMFPLTEQEARASLLQDLTNTLQISATAANNVTDPGKAFFDEIRVRLGRTESIIMLVNAGGILAFKLLKRFGRYLVQCASPIHLCLNICRAVTGMEQRLRKLNKYVLRAEPFEEALRNNHVVGVRSYNILANPFYQRVFQMQDGLAEERERSRTASRDIADTTTLKSEPSVAYRGYQSLQDALNIRKGTAVSSIESRALWKDDNKSSASGSTKVMGTLYSPPHTSKRAESQSSLISDNPQHDRSSYELDKESDVRSQAAKSTRSVKSNKVTTMEVTVQPSSPEDQV